MTKGNTRAGFDKDANGRTISEVVIPQLEAWRLLLPKVMS